MYIECNWYLDPVGKFISQAWVGQQDVVHRELGLHIIISNLYSASFQIWDSEGPSTQDMGATEVYRGYMRSIRGLYKVVGYKVVGRGI